MKKMVYNWGSPLILPQSKISKEKELIILFLLLIQKPGKMSKCDNQIKCHLVNLRNWEIDNHTLIYWNDKVYRAEGCKHVDNLWNLCKKVGYRVGGRGGCKQKHAVCLEHYRASEGCTCQPPSETHMASIMNLRTTYEHQIRIQLPGATRNARDELPA